MALTHLGVPADDLVVLEGVTVKDSTDLRQRTTFWRILPADGTYFAKSGTFGYTAPPNKALIITEVDWQYAAGDANGTVILRVFLTWPGLSSARDRRVLESTISLDSHGGGGTSTAVMTGVVVPHGVKITIDVIRPAPVGTGQVQHVLMRGYITDFDQGIRPTYGAIEEDLTVSTS